jgi:hypothetical protein
MDQMLNSIIEHPVAGGAGIFGMVCLAAYPMFRSRPLLLTAYLANNFGLQPTTLCWEMAPQNS